MGSNEVEQLESVSELRSSSPTDKSSKSSSPCSVSVGVYMVSMSGRVDSTEME